MVPSCTACRTAGRGGRPGAADGGRRGPGPPRRRCRRRRCRGRPGAAGRGAARERGTVPGPPSGTARPDDARGRAPVPRRRVATPAAGSDSRPGGNGTGGSATVSTADALRSPESPRTPGLAPHRGAAVRSRSGAMVKPRGHRGRRCAARGRLSTVSVGGQTALSATNRRQRAALYGGGGAGRAGRLDAAFASPPAARRTWCGPRRSPPSARRWR